MSPEPEYRSRRLVLSVFPGIDLLGRAFEEEGFCVVRGPDVIWGGDIRSFHPPAGVFKGVIGGDPCQAHSALVHLVRHNGNEARFPDMTTEYVRVVAEAQPDWFVRENVRQAPLPYVQGYDLWSILLVDAHVGGVQPRQRRICFGMREGLWPDALRSPLGLIEYQEAGATLPSLMRDARRTPVAIGGSGKLKRSIMADARQGTTGTRIRGGGGVLPHAGSILSIEDGCEAMGLPRDFSKHMPFTMQGKRSVIGNGVPMAMGRAMAQAVKRAMAYA